MTASNMAPVGSSASMKWAGAAAGIMLLDFIFSASDQKATAAWIAEARHNSLMVPGIFLFKPVPKAFEADNGYGVIRDADSVVTSLGIECLPAMLNAATESPAFIGGSSKVPSYLRLYACGYMPGETLATERTRKPDVRGLLVTGYTDVGGVLRFSLANLPAMHNMKRVLGVTDEAGEKNMGRLAYERVRGNVPADWTVVYTAPSETGKWTVYVSRNGVVEAFDAPEKL